MLHEELTEKIIKAYYKVYNELGYGFLEKVYENAMCIELDKMGLIFEPQKAIKVYYNTQVVGEYFTDILVENKVIVELKASKILVPENEAQLLNYLKATGIEIGLLFNFGKEPQFKRKIFIIKQKSYLIYV
jgi:GxxExxY protein